MLGRAAASPPRGRCVPAACSRPRGGQVAAVRLRRTRRVVTARAARPDHALDRSGGYLTSTSGRRVLDLTTRAGARPPRGVGRRGAAAALALRAPVRGCARALATPRPADGRRRSGCSATSPGEREPASPGAGAGGVAQHAGRDCPGAELLCRGRPPSGRGRATSAAMLPRGSGGLLRRVPPEPRLEAVRRRDEDAVKLLVLEVAALREHDQVAGALLDDERPVGLRERLAQQVPPEQLALEGRRSGGGRWYRACPTAPRAGSVSRSPGPRCRNSGGDRRRAARTRAPCG